MRSGRRSRPIDKVLSIGAKNARSGSGGPSADGGSYPHPALSRCREPLADLPSRGRWGGYVTRKRKLFEKQKERKKRTRLFGKVEIPREALNQVLKMGE